MRLSNRQLVTTRLPSLLLPSPVSLLVDVAGMLRFVPTMELYPREEACCADSRPPIVHPIVDKCGEEEVPLCVGNISVSRVIKGRF